MNDFFRGKFCCWCCRCYCCCCGCIISCNAFCLLSAVIFSLPLAGWVFKFELLHSVAHNTSIVNPQTVLRKHKKAICSFNNLCVSNGYAIEMLSFVYLRFNVYAINHNKEIWFSFSPFFRFALFLLISVEIIRVLCARVDVIPEPQKYI